MVVVTHKGEGGDWEGHPLEPPQDDEKMEDPAEDAAEEHGLSLGLGSSWTFRALLFPSVSSLLRFF